MQRSTSDLDWWPAGSACGPAEGGWMVCRECGKTVRAQDAPCAECRHVLKGRKPETVEALESVLISLIVVMGLVTWLLSVQAGYQR